MPVVIAENDTSQWEDETGRIYHFPKRYRGLLVKGTEAIYYKGRMNDKTFAPLRLSRAPHYFGVARIGEVRPDKRNDKGNFFALIEDFTPFESAVLAKIDGQYLEEIPSNHIKNYWRIAVRPIAQAGFDSILSHATPRFSQAGTGDWGSVDEQENFESANEGSKTSFFGTRYERCKDLRTKAIAIHGLDCKACGFNFEKAYGEHAKGFVHVHHVVPISKLGGEKSVNPDTDLVTLCANCHAVIHRKRSMTLSIDELKAMLRGKWRVTEP